MLHWVGRQGTRGVAVAVLSATLIPGLGDTFRPILGEVVFVLLTIAFVRLQATALRQHLHHPRVALSAFVWTALAIPLLIGALCQGLSINELAPQIYLALMLQAIASPMMATPAIVMLLGLDATVVLIVMVASTAALPLSSMAFAQLFIGAELELAPSELGLRLFVLLTGSAAVALLLRRILGAPRIVALKTEFDGLNIIALFVFAAAIMGSVVPNLIEHPQTVLLLTVVVFAVFFALQLLSTLLFLRAGREAACAIGFMCSQRNMGMMLVATAGAVSEQVWLYCALAQLPIYLGPMLLKPLVRRFALDTRLPSQ
ncbi:MAG: hypothetical protein ACI8W7_001621 [Gammaproteobacteria bacterium]|jgi:hypothetical protein